MTELQLFLSIFEREHKKVTLEYYEHGWAYELAVDNGEGSGFALYFDKDGKYETGFGFILKE